MSKIYKYIGWNDVDKDSNKARKIITENKIFLKTRETFNDPYDSYFIFSDEVEPTNRKSSTISNFEPARIQTIKQNLRSQFANVFIDCYSRVNDSILMFSHYADKHKGICLEFDSSFPPFKYAENVEYSRKVPIFNIESKNDRSITNQVILNKNIEWFYEEEVRITFPDPEEREIYPSTLDKMVKLGWEKHPQNILSLKFDPKALTGIVFGVEMSVANSLEIVRTCKELGLTIQYWKAHKNPMSYQLSLESYTIT